MNPKNEGKEKTRGRLFVSNIIGTSPIIQEVIRLIEKVSDSPLGVLITGESGTGKELVARTIHYNSSRFGKPFIDINCAALPESLLESELFGIEKGVATGVEKRVGKIEMASGGTLFLDEIGDMSLPAQTKLLRVLQEKKLERVGGRNAIEVDVRVLAATNKDLKNEIRKGSFREDLYYRLNVVHIHMPPLREMKEDILLLAQYFLSSFANELVRGSMHFSSEAMECLVNYGWPGNVRELENEVKRAAVMAERDVLDESDLSENLRSVAQSVGETRAIDRLRAHSRFAGSAKAFKEAVEEFEIHLIKEALEKNRGNKQKTAKILGFTRQGLIKKIKRYEKALASTEIDRLGGKQKDKGARIRPKKAVPAGSRQAERRHLTVMFCDLVGFAALSEQIDPEDLHEVMRIYLDVCSKVVSRFDGHIAKQFGDGFLVYFGYPVAHEDDAQRAVRAGLEIVGAKHDSPLQVRIGIHTGLVVIGGMRVENMPESIAIVGEAPNIATQLLTVAEPATVVISSATHQLVEGLFDYNYLGVHTLKGFSTPLGVYRVLHESGVWSRFDLAVTKGLTPLVGRAEEVGLLLEHWERVKDGAGQVATIIGDAGIGKSRLLYEFRKLIEDEKIPYLEGRCISYGKSISYLPIIDIMKKRFGIDKLDTERTIRKKIEKGISDIAPNLERSIPFLYDILSIETDAPLLKHLDLRDKRKRTLEALKNIILADSNLRPLVVAIENIHWIDGASEEFLTFLIDNIPNSKIMLILTSRPGYRIRWSEKSYHIQIASSRLPDKEVEEMIKSILENQKTSKELVKLVTDKADGIPFYVEEIIKSFTESGIIVSGEDGYSVSKKIAKVDVPDTIQDIIMARIDRLEERLKNTLQYASLIGREFSYKLLREIMEVGEELQDHLTDLKGLELVYEKSLFPDLEYRFKHSLTQEVAYNSLLIKKRKELHGKIGEIIEDLYGDKLEENYELLAYHYGRSTRDEKAVNYLTLAGDKSAKIYSTEDAIGYYEEALKRLDMMPDIRANKERRVDIFIKQARVMRLMNRFKEHIRTLEKNLPIVEELGDNNKLAEYYFKMSFYYSVLGDLADAILCGTKSIELAELIKNERIIGLASVRQGYNYLYKGEFKKVIPIVQKGVKILERLGEHHWLARSFEAIGAYYWFTGNWDKSINYIQKLLKKSEEISDNNLMALACWFAALPHLEKGEWDIAIKYCERCLEMSPPPIFATFATGFLGAAYYKDGQLKKGIECMEKAIQQGKQFGLKLQEVVTSIYLGEAYLSIGERDKALETIKRALEISKDSGFRHWEGMAYRVLGEIYGGTEFNKAKNYIEGSIRILKEIGAKNELAKSYISLGRLYQEKGEKDKSKKYATQALHIFEKLGTLHEPEKARKVLRDFG